MRLSRTLLYGGLIGGVAAWSYLTFEGLAGAAGLFIVGFDVLVLSGILLATLTEDINGRTWDRVGSSVRTIKNRRSMREICNGCARFIVDMGTVRYCTACDRIHTTLSY